MRVRRWRLRRLVGHVSLQILFDVSLLYADGSL
jgi:hypothetical protein